MVKVAINVFKNLFFFKRISDIAQKSMLNQKTKRK